MVAAGYGYALHVASYRIRIYEGIFQIRSLFRNIDFTADDVAETTEESLGNQAIFRVRLKSGKRVSIDYNKLNLGEFRQVFQEKMRRRTKKRK